MFFFDWLLCGVFRRTPPPPPFIPATTATVKASQNGGADIDDVLSLPKRYDPEDTVLRAVEAAVRSAGGGPDSPPRPIGVGLPATAAGAEAAKVR